MIQRKTKKGAASWQQLWSKPIQSWIRTDRESHNSHNNKHIIPIPSPIRLIIHPSLIHHHTCIIIIIISSKIISHQYDTMTPVRSSTCPSCPWSLYQFHFWMEHKYPNPTIHSSNLSKPWKLVSQNNDMWNVPYIRPSIWSQTLNFSLAEFLHKATIKTCRNFPVKKI